MLTLAADNVTHSTTATILTLAATVFICIGVFFMFVAALGLTRMPDFYNRMHASTKGVTLGVVCMLVGILLAAISFHTSAYDAFTKIVLIILFQFVANPVGAHLLSKAAHRDGVEQWSGTLEDQLEGENVIGSE